MRNELTRTRPLILLALLLAAGSLLPARALDAQARTRVASGRGTPGWLGFSINSWASPDEARGILVQGVVDGSPAARAGLLRGDTIMRLNGLTATPRLVGSVARSLQAGDTVRLDIRRAGRERRLVAVSEPRPLAMGRGEPGPWNVITVDGDSIRRALRVYLDSARVQLDSLRLPRIRVETGDSGMVMLFRDGRTGALRADTIDFHWSDSLNHALQGLHFRLDSLGEHLNATVPDLYLRKLETEPGGFAFAFGIGEHAVAGAELSPLNASLGHYFGTSSGLLVLRVAPGTPAARAGLRPGDVIVRAADHAVRDIPDLRGIVASKRHDRLPLEVLRQGKRTRLEMRWD